MNKLVGWLALGLLAIGCNSAYQEVATEAPTKAELSEAEKEARRQEIGMHLSFATEYKKQGAYREAADNYTKVFRLDEELDKAAHLKYWSLCYSQMEMPDSAIAIMELAVEQRPDEYYERVSLARLYDNNGMDGKALEAYRAAVGLKADDSASWLAIKKIQENQARDKGDTMSWQAVLETLDTLIGLEPDNTSYLEEKTRIMKRNFSIQDIIQTLEEQVAADPTNVKARTDLARAYLDFATPQAYAKAGPLLDALASEAPDARIYRMQADCRIQVNNLSGGIEALKKLDELEGGTAETRVRIGNLYMEQGQLKAARTWANRAISSEASFGGSYILRAKIVEAQVDQCAAAGKLDFYDKLAYELAGQEYDRVSDPSFRGTARSRKDALEPVLPTKGDRFLNQGKTLEGHDCYGWLVQ